MKALIDGDIIAYSCGFSAEGTFYQTEDGEQFKYKKEAITHCEDCSLDIDNISKHINPDPIENCLHSVKLMLSSIVEDSGADEYVVYLTGEGNYREEVATILPYKGNRTAAKPFHYQNIRDYLTGKHRAEVVDGMEADDMMGIVQYKNWKYEHGLDTVICSIDKDLDMIPGWHYNWNKQEKYYVDDDEGMRHYYHQLLTGDRTDNIQGIPGIGKQKADKLLSQCTTEEDMWETVLDAYMAYYNELSASEVMCVVKENAKLLWIVRELDADGNPVHWTPPVLEEEE